MTAAENLVTSEETVLVPITDIVESSVPNYRKTMSEPKLVELTDSIKESGVLVPLVVRPTKLGLELVIGERRKTAAARAGLSVVPCFVREYDDDQVREARVIENLVRDNPDPLDEAEAFAELERMGHSASAIAAKLGQSLAYVGQRLKLTGLCPDAREALGKGEISIGVAVLIARLPDKKTQEKALKESTSWDGNLVSVEQARENIENRVLLDLAEAPFQLTDPDLVPKAGACIACPKRTGNQASLFPGDSSEDHCTDPPCHKSKMDAHWQIRVKEAKKDGVEVLDKKKAEEALRYSSTHGNGPLMRLDEQVYGKGGKATTLRKLFGNELPPVTLARDTYKGTPVELVPRKAAEKAINAFKPSEKRESSGGGDNKSKQEREAERVEAEVRRRTMAALVKAMEDVCAKGQPSKALLRLLVRGALESVWTDITKKVADRRGLPLTDEAAGSPKKGAKRQLPRLTATQRIERHLPELDEGHLLALLLELVMGRAAPGKWSDGADCYLDCCAELDVRITDFEMQVKAEKKAKTEAKGKPAKAAKPSKPTKKKAAKKPRKPRGSKPPAPEYESDEPEGDGG